jgi:hypothetical protein
MKKTLKQAVVLCGALFIFCVSEAAAAGPVPRFAEDMRMNIVRNALNRINSVASILSRDEIRDNPGAVVTRLRNEIPQQADIFVLDSLRKVFTRRILGFMQESLERNVLDILRATASLDAVVQEFDARR